jgi:fatty-acyl-CoA synthase
MLYGDWIGRWGQSDPGREAVFDAISGGRFSYGEMARNVHRMADFLAGTLGVGKGDRVCCLALNRVEYIWLFFALSRLGAILVPLNFRLAPGEYVYYVEDAAPKAFFFDRSHLERVRSLQALVDIDHWVCLDDTGEGFCLPTAWSGLSTAPPGDVELDAGDPQLIIYTSGTTGLPKGVVLTHGMIEANAVNTILGWDISSSDRTILHAAMFYTAGWNVFTLPLFLARGVNVLVQGFEADLVLDLIGRERITLFFGVPTMYRMMLDSPKFARTDFGSLRFAVSGGAPLHRQIFEAYEHQKGIHIWEGYGLTEVGPNNFMANGKPGTLGHPMPGVDVRLVDEQGHRVAAGGEGEILLRGRHVCSGYWEKPQATAESIRDGWFHTGDLGRVDEDGHFAIVGRLKDMIISGGVNVYPAEIERAIESHPDVIGAAVIGVPDAKWGEVGKAVVELRSGSRLNLQALNDYLGDKLGRFKLPKYLAVVEELPRTPASGKIQKFLIQQSHGKADNR